MTTSAGPGRTTMASPITSTVLPTTSVTDFLASFTVLRELSDSDQRLQRRGIPVRAPQGCQHAHDHDAAEDERAEDPPEQDSVLKSQGDLETGEDQGDDEEPGRSDAAAARPSLPLRWVPFDHDLPFQPRTLNL